jgi:AcrR family transcriptional regulator
MAGIAERAGVAVDTVYALFGKKAALIEALVEAAISQSDTPLPALQREFVARIRRCSRAADMLALYAQVVSVVHQELAPLVLVIQRAAQSEPTLDQLWQSIAARRAANMLLFADDLIATGDLRRGLTREALADIVWSTNAPEYYALLVTERGWPAARFEAWLSEAWCRLFLSAAALSAARL